MKIFKKLGLALAALVLVSFAEAQAQDCNSFYEFREGAFRKYISYDKKGKEEGSTTQKLTNVKAEGSTASATIASELFDKKGKSIGNNTLEMKCQDGVLAFDMRRFAMQNMPDMSNADLKMELSGDQMDLPSTLSVGQKLKDVTFSLKANMSGVSMMNRSFSITNRTVEAAEKITTPAGEFDCFRISHLTTTKAPLGIGKDIVIKTVDWYAKGIGMVKSESYDGKGNLQSTTVLAEKQ